LLRGFRRLFLNADRHVVFVEFHNAVALRIAYVVREDEAAIEHCVRAQFAPQARSVEDVVTEDQGHGILSDEVASNDERLRQAVRNGLFSIGKFATEIFSVAEQFPEMR
jgi:hypothetical protein